MKSLRFRERSKAFVVWLAGALMAAALGAFFFEPPFQTRTCEVTALQPVCRALELGHLPDVREDAEWRRALSDHTSAGLKSYLNDYPSGYYRELAETKLHACRPDMRTDWSDETQALMIAGAMGDAFSTETAARTDALIRLHRDALTRCGTLDTSLSKSRGVQERPSDWDCRKLAGAYRCYVTGTAICKRSVRHDYASEVCNTPTNG